MGGSAEYVFPIFKAADCVRKCKFHPVMTQDGVKYDKHILHLSKDNSLGIEKIDGMVLSLVLKRNL